MQSGRLLDFGNVRLVGMTPDEFRDMFQLRIDNHQRVWMLPDAVVQETVKAYNTSATSATGYGSLGPPSGKYIAPADSATCIESIAAGYGDCGLRTLVVRGPMSSRVDMTLGKITQVRGKVRVEARLDVYNICNRVNFMPTTGVGGTTASDYEVTGVAGSTDESRQMQLVFKLTW